MNTSSVNRLNTERGRVRGKERERERGREREGGRGGERERKGASTGPSSRRLELHSYHPHQVAHNHHNSSSRAPTPNQNFLLALEVPVLTFIIIQSIIKKKAI